MRKPAFSLIETLIAFAIVVVVLGAGIAANRVILTNALINDERTQMNALVEEAVSELALLQQRLKLIPASFGDPVHGFNLPASSPVDTTTTTIPYVSPLPTATQDLTTIHWCTPTHVTCLAQASSVRVNPRSALTMSAMLTLSDPGGELVAIRRAPWNGRQAVHMASRLSGDGMVASVQNPDGDQNWSFYVRKISVTRLGGGTSVYGQPISLSQAAARNKMFRVTITVSKYGNPSIPAVSQTLLLTDY